MRPVTFGWFHRDNDHGAIEISKFVAVDFIYPTFCGQHE